MVASFKKARTEQSALAEVVTFQHTIDISPMLWDRIYLLWGFFNETREDDSLAPPPEYKATRLSVSLDVH